MTDDGIRTRELLAREEIREVLARVARGTDRQDASLIRSGYQPYGIDDHGIFYGTGSEFADWAAASLAGCRTQHLIGQSIIELHGDVAFAETYANCNLIRPAVDGRPESDLFHGVRYLDRFERRDRGPWLIAYRLVCFDWAFYLSAGALAEMPDTTTWGRPGDGDPSSRLAELLKRPSQRRRHDEV